MSVVLIWFIIYLLVMEEEIKDRINMIIHTEVENRCYNIERTNEELEEENRKLKLHIEAKDKAYTALLKDYEEIKEDRDRMKAEIEQRLNSFRNR